MEELKYFYQYMRAFTEKSGKFAKDWAKGLATLKDRAAPGQIVDELSAILRRRNELQADAERLAKFYEGDSSATEFVELSRETRNNICAELDALFAELCRALDAEGLTLTGGQISALKRAGLPDALAEELEAIKGEHLASIPERERLDDRSAAALYEELTRQRLICGPYAAFAYYLGQVTRGKKKAPGEGLKWTGNKAEFAYFARLFSEFTQPVGMGQPYIREKALCRAFGFDDRPRVNTIRPYLSDQHKPRTSAKIEAAFAAARRVKNEALEASTGELGETPALAASTPNKRYSNNSK